MTIGTHKEYPLEIGKVYRGLNNPNGEYDDDIHYKVIKESTKEAYDQTCMELGVKPEWDNPYFPKYIYYEVQTD
jgi:hypothetical protein